MLTFQFLPYRDIEHLDSNARITKILKMVKDDKIVLLEGRLKSHEETELIAKTMEQVSKKFKGIELGVIHPDREDMTDAWQKLKSKFVKILLGDRDGFTIVGPASIIKEIKNDPEKIQLFARDKKR